VTQATAEIPAAATKSEGPVTVPVTVAATKSSASATVVNITVEDNSKAKIEIPVADVKPGVVAIVVKPDGTEEILKTSSISDTGVLLTIDGSADIKLVDNSKDFSDVPETQWYNDSVDFVSAREIMSGTSDDNFSPNVEMSRAMLTQVLYSLEGKPAAGENNFRDVKDSDWFDDAVSWAVENSIISGVGDGQFAPNASLTREQMAVILYGYAKNKGLDTTISGNLGDFKDANKASDWSRTALEWALGAGMISGKGDGILDPTGTSTRAEIATILTGFCKFMAQ
jgi:hypothetical protein